MQQNLSSEDLQRFKLDRKVLGVPGKEIAALG